MGKNFPASFGIDLISIEQQSFQKEDESAKVGLLCRQTCIYLQGNVTYKALSTLLGVKNRICAWKGRKRLRGWIGKTVRIDGWGCSIRVLSGKQCVSQQRMAPGQWSKTPMETLLYSQTSLYIIIDLNRYVCVVGLARLTTFYSKCEWGMITKGIIRKVNLTQIHVWNQWRWAAMKSWLALLRVSWYYSPRIIWHY